MWTPVVSRRLPKRVSSKRVASAFLPKKVVTAFLLRTSDDGEYRVVVLTHRRSGEKCLPGGWIEATDATSVVAAVRELHEETMNLLKVLPGFDDDDGLPPIVSEPLEVLMAEVGPRDVRREYHNPFSCAVGYRIRERAASHGPSTSTCPTAMYIMALTRCVTRQQLDGIELAFQCRADAQDRLIRDHMKGVYEGPIPTPSEREMSKVQFPLVAEVMQGMRGTGKNTTKPWWVDTHSAWHVHGLGDAVQDYIQSQH